MNTLQYLLQLVEITIHKAFYVEGRYCYIGQKNMYVFLVNDSLIVSDSTRNMFCFIYTTENK